ncbi:MAG TPA: hypothetical protein VFG59_07435 [Anaeromyxobacter sp.]|nr:hypothetical protein [Anaeromyxobacter sp.]
MDIAVTRGAGPPAAGHRHSQAVHPLGMGKAARVPGSGRRASWQCSVLVAQKLWPPAKA